MKSPIVIIFSLSCLSGFAQFTSSPPVIAYDNCELDPVYQWEGDRTRKWSYWTGSDHILPGSSTTASITRSNAHARKGSYSYKARITKDLTYKESSNTFRSELNFSTPGQKPIGWRWAAVSIFIPEDFCVDYVPMTIAFNTKASPDDYTTPFRLDTRNGHYFAVRANIQTDGSVPGEVSVDLGPIDKGQWVDWVYNRNFTQDSDGYQRLYKNGILVWSYNGPNWKTGPGRAPEGYLQQGLYKWPWISPNGEGWGPPACNDPIEIFYDEYKWGDGNATLQHFKITPPPVSNIPTRN